MKKPTKQTFILQIKDEIPTDKAVEAIKTIFEFETPYQGQRLVSFILGLRGEFVRVVMGKARRPKSQSALGFYFGVLLPACTLDFKGLEYDPVQISDTFKLYKKEKKVNSFDLDDTDETLRREFHYVVFHNKITGEMERRPDDLSDKDNEDLLKLIDKVSDWRAEQGYQFINPDEYKEWRDEAKEL